MLPAFAEAVRATTQPCTLLLLLPPLAMAVTTRGRWAPLAAICVGAVLGGWLFIANVVALSDAQLQLSGLLVVVAIAVVVVAPHVPQLRWAAALGVEVAVAGGVSFFATLWWRPCIGTELGSILTAARLGLPGQLPGITAYMLGAMVPVLAVVLALHTIDPSAAAARRAGWIAGGVGIATAGALTIGRHDQLVSALTRWTVS
jgi:cytochrome c biogenesis protein CcdA